MPLPALRQLSPGIVRGLLDGRVAGERTCLSLYLPTHPRVPESAVDQPTYRGLVNALRHGLADGRRRDEIERLLAPFDLLAEDRDFWRHVRHGLAILAADGHADGFVLPADVPPRAVVAPRFHVLPLLEMVSAAWPFRLLLLTSREARFYAGTAVGGRVADLAACPLPAAAGPGAGRGRLSRADVVATEVHEPHRAVRLHTGQAVLHGGFGSRQDEIDDDTVTFVRHVAAQVAAASPGATPLILAAAGHVAAILRQVAPPPGLLDRGIEKNLHLAPEAALADGCGPLIADLAADRAADLLAGFIDARGRGLAGGNLRDIGRAAVAGRIATLLVERDRSEPGEFDRATGELQIAPAGTAADTPAADILAAIAETVFLHGGAVQMAARNALPTNSGMAAIYRW